MKTLTVLIKLLSGIFLFSNSYAQADLHVYKVGAAVAVRSDSYGNDFHGLAPPLARFEIGAAKRNNRPVPVPSRKDFEQLMLIGSEGVATKTDFYEFKKICDFLCATRATFRIHPGAEAGAGRA